MAGTIFSLALSQRLDSQGRPLLNAPLFFYEANTSTPVDSFSDFGLSLENEWPLRTNGAGMIPPFWLPDGQYRVRFTDEAGAVVYFDMPNVQTVGPSEGGEGGDGGDGVDPNAIHQTGDMIWKPVSGVRPGWVRANFRTIGSATSGATERANADTQPLYEFLWNNFSNVLCPVTGGRGASAAADFAANKPIGILDMRGRGPMGLDTMGNNAAGVITGGMPTAPGSAGGSEKLTIPRSALPNVTLSLTTNNAGQHSHPYTRFESIGNGSLGGSGSALWVGTSTQNTANGGLHLHTGTTASINGGVDQTPLNAMSPYTLGTYYIKL